MDTSISIVGLGHLGLPLAVALAYRGFSVVGVDNDPTVIDAITAGKPKYIETDLQEYLQRVTPDHFRLDTLENAIQDTDITIILVATPSSTGHPAFSLEYVLPICKDIGAAIREKQDHLIVISSTTMPGDCNGRIREVIESASGRAMGDGWDLCYCPEFVALGTVLHNFLSPDFVVIGAERETVWERMGQVYQQLCADQPPIAYMSLINAEIMKLSLNCYVATKITFGNQLAAYCEHIPGAHIDHIVDAMYLDRRVGSGYMAGATGYGGPCFPRDTLALPYAARQAGAHMPIVEHIHVWNHLAPDRLLDTVFRYCDEYEHMAAKIGILGLTYKPGVCSTQGATGAYLVDALSAMDKDFTCYDPLIDIPKHSATTAQACVDDCDVIVVTTPWPEFWDVRFHAGQHIIDCWRVFDTDDVESQGAIHVPIGVGRA